MEFRLISFRLGNILDFGEASDAEGIKKFASERPNADAFHAHPKEKKYSFYLSGFRLCRENITWKKEIYTGRSQFA